MDIEKTLIDTLITVCKDEAYQVTFQGKNRATAYNELILKKEGIREVADTMGKMAAFDRFSKQTIIDNFNTVVGL